MRVFVCCRNLLAYESNKLQELLGDLNIHRIIITTKYILTPAWGGSSNYDIQSPPSLPSGLSFLQNVVFS